MTRLGLWPEFARGAPFGDRYVAVNDAIGAACRTLGVDRWTVDSLWWKTEQEHAPDKHQFDGQSSGAGSRSPGRGRRARLSETFLCEICFAHKAIHLQVDDRPGVCVDCLR